ESTYERAACRRTQKREAGQGLEQEGGLGKATPAAARRYHPPARLDPPHGVLSVTNIGPPGCRPATLPRSRRTVPDASARAAHPPASASAFSLPSILWARSWRSTSCRSSASQ